MYEYNYNATPSTKKQSGCGCLGALGVLATLVTIVGGIVAILVSFGAIPFKPPPTPTATAPATVTATPSVFKPDPYRPGTPMIVRDFIPGKSIPDETWDTNAHCYNEGTKYHIIIPNHQFYSCFAYHNYANFVFEATMTISTGIGTRGGIILRASKTQGKFYTYDFGLNGDFALWYYPDSSGATATRLASGTTGSFKTGLGAKNVLAIVANGSTFDLYVNHQKIKTVPVPPTFLYTQGQLGVYAYSTGNVASEIFYSDLTIWRIS